MKNTTNWKTRCARESKIRTNEKAIRRKRNKWNSNKTKTRKKGETENALMVEIARWPQCAGTRSPKCSHAPGMVVPLAYAVSPLHLGQLLESTLGGGQHPFDEREQK